MPPPAFRARTRRDPGAPRRERRAGRSPPRRSPPPCLRAAVLGRARRRRLTRTRLGYAGLGVEIAGQLDCAWGVPRGSRAQHRPPLAGRTSVGELVDRGPERVRSERVKRASARRRYLGGLRGDASRMPESAQDPAEWPTRRCRTSRPSAGRPSPPCAAPSSGPPASARSRRSPRRSPHRRHRRAAARAGRGLRRRTGR